MLVFKQVYSRYIIVGGFKDCKAKKKKIIIIIIIQSFKLMFFLTLPSLSEKKNMYQKCSLLWSAR